MEFAAAGIFVLVFALGGLLILLADIYAILITLKSGESDGMKLIWVLLVVFMPVVGLIIWFLAGPRAGSA